MLGSRASIRSSLILLCASLALLAALALSDDATAWTTQDVNFTNDGDESGRVQDSGGVYYKHLLTNTTGFASMGIGTTWWGYMSIPLSPLDDRTYLRSATVHFYAYGLTYGGAQVQVRLLTVDPRYTGPATLWDAIGSSPLLGTSSIQLDFYQYYSVAITGSALDTLRERIGDDEPYLTIGFASSSASSLVYQRYSNLHSYIRLEYDDSPPTVPTPDPLDAFTAGDTLSISWSASADLPTGGNVGGVLYQLGLFLNTSSPGEPWHLTSWLDGTSWSLSHPEDGREYIAAVRARDASGFASDWSSPASTTVDNSPPSVPLMQPEPALTKGSANTFSWWPSEDAGVGNVSYEYQFDRDPSFPGEVYRHTTGTSVTLEDLLDSTYYYRVRSLDGMGHASAWSPVERSTQDSQPPTVPVPVPMPAFSPGNSSTFSWCPSHDDGVGVQLYNVWVATVNATGELITVASESFGPGEVQGTFEGLEDGVTYLYHVRAVDGFSQASNWSAPVSSTQDASPPSAPVLHPLPEFLPKGPVTLTWGPAVDHGVGISHYGFWWHAVGIPGSSPMLYSFDVIGQSITIPDLGEGKWRFGVYAVDRFGHTSPVSFNETTIDATIPPVPVMKPLPEFITRRTCDLSWSEPSDVSGISRYLLLYYPYGHALDPVRVETTQRRLEVRGLEDGTRYFFKVVAYDGVGNPSVMSSEPVSTTIDVSAPPAPVVLDVPPVIDRREITLIWDQEPDASGRPIEFQVMTWVPPDLDMEPSVVVPWTDATQVKVEDLVGGASYEWCVVARDHVGHVSEPSDVVRFQVDVTPPEVDVTAPEEGSVLSGVVGVRGTFDDGNPVAYHIQYQAAGEDRWWDVVLSRPVGLDDHLVETWSTAGLPDGTYSLRITVEDVVGFAGTASVNVTLANARLWMGPLDLSFSDPRPKHGEEIIVILEVSNLGEADAEGVTVEFRMDGELRHTEEGLTVPARSSILVSYRATALYGQEHSARAFSDLYDAGEVSWTVVTEDREVTTDEGDGGAMALGALAVVIAVVALLVALASRQKPVDMGEWEETRE